MLFTIVRQDITKLKADAKGKTEVEVYKRANLDRKLFSKLRSNKCYMLSKRTAIALAIALELSLDETDDLLERAGYALPRAVKFDVMVEYFIVSGKYDIFAINEVLFDNNYELLHDRINIRAVSPKTEKEYQVGGSTALLDAIGTTIHKIGNAQKHTADDYRADSEGTELNFKVMGAAVATFREAGKVDDACFEEIRKDVKRRGTRPQVRK